MSYLYALAVTVAIFEPNGWVRTRRDKHALTSQLHPAQPAEDAGITILIVGQTSWHLPAKFKAELFGDFHQFVLEETRRLRRHGFGIDPAPH